MRQLGALTLSLAIGLSGTRVLAQDKVAEGTYEFHGVSASGAPLISPDTHWILYSRPSGGYRLESEVGNRPQGNRFVQIEELDERLIPSSVVFTLFEDNQKDPAFRAECRLTAGIICSLRGDEEQLSANTQPYRHKGPFEIFLKDFGAIDLVWLLAGAINMAKAEGSNTNIADIVVSDSNKPHEIEFRVDTKKPLNFVGSETMKLNGKNIRVRHYTYGSDEDVWVTNSGILVKRSQGKDQDVLSGYRQYKKLIPELSVETLK